MTWDGMLIQLVNGIEAVLGPPFAAFVFKQWRNQAQFFEGAKNQ